MSIGLGTAIKNWFHVKEKALTKETVGLSPHELFDVGFKQKAAAQKRQSGEDRNRNSYAKGHVRKGSGK